MQNIQGAALMVLAMLCFAVEDMFIKLLAASLPMGQILFLIAALSALGFVGLLLATGDRPVLDLIRNRAVIGRCLADVTGTVGFLLAILLIPLSTASAILQATPLFVTAGAALILKETVGWRRWAATCAGLLGVLLIIRPGTAEFDVNALFAVLAVVGLGSRDLFTRRLPAGISTAKVSAYAFLALIPTGLLMLWLQGTPPVAPRGNDMSLLLAATAVGMVAYLSIVAATRIGDASMVAPFRYSRLFFAMVIGMAVFGERPDALTLLGSAIVVASGLYAFWREARLASLPERRVVRRG